MDNFRARIVDEALSWIGTPYQHQMSKKGDGCDCLGLVRGVWRYLYKTEPSPVPSYSPDWAERTGEESLQNACAQYLLPTPLCSVNVADVLLFRMKPGVPAKHLAILVEPNIIVHAYWGRAVTRSLLAPFWIKRRVGAYAFPQEASCRA